MSAGTEAIPRGLCQCGCGRPAPLARQTSTYRGYVKGHPVRFIAGHHRRPVAGAQIHTIRQWLARNYPKSGRCEKCGREAGKQAHSYVNVTGSYTRDRADYRELCRRCRPAFDGSRGRPQPRGPQSSAWKGRRAKYAAVHSWLRNNFPKAGVCEHCGAVAEGRPHHYANVSGEYRRDRADYLELCGSCHVKFDRCGYEICGVVKTTRGGD